MVTEIGLDPFTRFARSLPGEHYLLREVAAFLGTSGRVLRRLMREHSELGPSHSAMRGGTRMYLYSPADVERLRAYLADHAHRNAGAPVMWSAAEYTARQRGHSRAYRARRKAAELTARGEVEAAAKATATADAINAQLWAQYNKRAVEIFGF